MRYLLAILFPYFTFSMFAGTIRLAFDPSPDASQVASYTMYRQVGTNVTAFNVGLSLTNTFPTVSGNNSFYVTAIGTNGSESDVSPNLIEIIVRPPGGPRKP